MPFSVPRQAWWERLLSPRPPAPGGRPPRARRVAVASGLLLLLGVGAGLALHLYLNSDGVIFALRGRLEGELEARGLHSTLSEVRVDWLGRVTVRDFRLPAHAGGPAVLEAALVRVRPSYRALLHGRVQAASVVFVDAQVAPGPHGAAARELWERLKGRAPRHVRAADFAHEDYPVVKVEHALVRLESARAPAGGWLIGPLDGELTVSREVEHHEVDARLTLPGGGGVKLLARWGANEPLIGELWAEDLTQGVLPKDAQARLPLQVEAGVLGAHLRLDAAPNLRTGAVTFSVQGERLVVRGERLAQEPVGPWRAGVSGTARWDRSRRKVRLDDAELTVGAHDAARVGLSAEAAYAAPYAFRFDAHVDKLPYQAVVDALPPQLTPGSTAPRLDGPVSAQLTLQGLLTEPEGWAVNVNLDLSRLKETARGTPTRLKGPFLYQPREGSGPVRDIWVGDRNPSFVPLAQLPSYVYRAVTTSEDAGFFGHHGFDFQEMKNSFVSVAEEKRFRGASTITQQLAKNLFLSRERTWARKVQEALVTVALEASLSKQRLLEIYLNIIEWGPGIYGLGEAAQHYFGKDARALTPKEAAFLATIIPNPIRYHMYFTRGALTETWERRVQDLLVKMHDQGVLTDMEYMDAERAPLVFRSRDGRGGLTAGDRRVDRGAQPWSPLPLPRAAP